MKGERRMEDYASNSNKAKRAQTEAQAPEEQKPAAKIVTGSVKIKKQNEFQKALGSVIVSDLRTIGAYFLKEKLIPMVKKLVFEGGSDALHMALYGEASHSKSSSGGSKISYNGYYKSEENRPVTTATGRDDLFEYERIVIEHRGDAEAVLDDLKEAIDHGYLVSVGDLYEKLGVTKPFTAQKYGWSDLSTARIVHTTDGYILKMPKPKPLD